MQIEILFFATLCDLADEKRLSLSIAQETQTVAELRAHLMDVYPHMAENLQVALVAINEEFAFDGDIIQSGDEVAFFPPVSGGSEPELPEVFLLPYEPVDHNELIQAVTTPATGAVCVFSGVVRAETRRDGYVPKTSRLEYEAYEPMALAKMRQVAVEIRERFPLVEGID